MSQLASRAQSTNTVPLSCLSQTEILKNLLAGKVVAVEEQKAEQCSPTCSKRDGPARQDTVRADFGSFPVSLVCLGMCFTAPTADKERTFCPSPFCLV